MYFARPIIVIFRHDPLPHTSKLLPPRNLWRHSVAVSSYLSTSLICYLPFDPVPCATSYKPIKEVIASPKKPHSAVRHNSDPVSLSLRMAIRPTNQPIIPDLWRHLTASSNYFAVPLSLSQTRLDLCRFLRPSLGSPREESLGGRGGGCVGLISRAALGNRAYPHIWQQTVQP